MNLSLSRILLVLALVCGCKQVQDDQRQPKVKVGESQSAQFQATGGVEVKRNRDFFYKIWRQTLETRLSALPSSGSTMPNKTPKSGSWYPELRGGTNVVVSGTQTPLEKYDAAFHGGAPKAADWEKANHNPPPRQPNESRDEYNQKYSWYGHCNGFAAAAQRFPREPREGEFADINGVRFTARDIKALLAEVHMNAQWRIKPGADWFMVGNRCEDESISSSRPDPTSLDACQDTNPGTMHVILGNWIGRMQHTLIMDQSSNKQVWNFPLYAYDVTSNQSITKADALRDLTGSTSGAYEFNPNAVAFARVTAVLKYANAYSPPTSTSAVEILGQTNPKTMTVSYILELDADDNIIGGEWIGESKTKHPDFLWVALQPLRPSGSKSMGNPFVDYDQVVRIWATATGHDVDNPPIDIVYPDDSEAWGQFADFDLILDGNQRGAVFAGKQVTLEFRKKGLLANGSIDLKIKINGDTIDKDSETGASSYYKFAPEIGLNKLSITVSSARTSQISEDLRFHVMR